LTSDEQDLIWTYRYYLVRFKKALPKFLKCIDWEDEQEVTVAMELVDLWEFIDVEDALGLLSAQFTHSFVRLYAVKRLEDANDDDLRLYLLQLVQALKFENSDDAKKDGISPLGAFLISRACNNCFFGNYFYWYLVVECEDDTDKAASDLYRGILNGYSNELKRRGEKGVQQRKVLRKQTDLIGTLRQILGSLGKGTRPQKIELLKLALRDSGLENFETDFPLPLDPTIRICGIIPEKATLFKSSMMPARLTFKTVGGGEYVTIFKNGDDLRQDQLILQVIELMDKLLCKENLNLKLKPYRALATGPAHGFLQFVDSKAVAQVLQQDGTILNYFMKQSHDGKTVEPDIMDTYIRSCAGYCVITYLLGVGDRHLDNLMLTKHGHLLHIDFGYILGRDPKPFPPPMKLSKEMVEVMGGLNSAEYASFREHCYNAFLILRRSASLIINLFSLMLRANIPDISIDPDGAVRKVQDKFGLDLSEEEAVQLFQQIIDESITALFSALWENVHKWAQYWRR
jgi:phosphatidylinositol 3-kinase